MLTRRTFIAGAAATCATSRAHATPPGFHKITFKHLKPGDQVAFRMSGDTYLLRYRTQAEIKAARHIDAAALPRPIDWFGNSPVPADDRLRSVDPEGRYLLLRITCGPLGHVVIPGFESAYFCPYSGVRYDTSGRALTDKFENLYAPMAWIDGDHIVVAPLQYAIAQLTIPKALGWR